MSNAKQPTFNVFSITEREGKDAQFKGIGAGFVNSDNSFNLQLNVMPLSGKLYLKVNEGSVYDMPLAEDKKPTFKVMSVKESAGKKPWYTEVGVGFINSNGSINIVLDHLPFEPKLHVRVIEAKENHGDDQQGAPAAEPAPNTARRRAKAAS